MREMQDTAGERVRNMQASVGRVERRNKHTGTVLFLGKGILLAFLVIWLVQLFAQPPSCELNIDIKDLPTKNQELLIQEDKVAEIVCPAFGGEGSVTLRIQTSDENRNKSDTEDITNIRILKAERIGKSGGPHYFPFSSSEICKDMKSTLSSQECTQKSQGLEDVVKVEIPKEGRNVFRIYFLLGVGFLFLCLIFMAIYKTTMGLCGGKRLSEATIA